VLTKPDAGAELRLVGHTLRFAEGADG
jgi:hypothetical protein